MPAIEVDELTVVRGDHLAVDQVSFSADEATITALLGPNGAGKTSTVETLEGFLRPDSGRVRVVGLDPVTDHGGLVERMGVMLQEGGVPVAMRPLEALQLHAAFHQEAHDPHELLERVGMADRWRTPWRHLSGGERQRVSLALALVGRPEVVFLDEPTAGVDLEGRRSIRRLIEGLRDDGVTVLLTTHDLDEVEELADHVVIIDHGRLIASGSPEGLMSSGAQHEFRFAAPAGLDVEALTPAVDAQVSEDRRGEYLVEGEPSPQRIAALAAWLAQFDVPLGDLRAGRQRLEDVFLALTSEKSDAGDGTGRRGGRRRRGGLR
ncbi:MAG: ABC transporter ATP-binding protein [Actinomycetia bacterium]|nr:ABC transporter ATP-binding protein [Actinomycetes bacterium]